MKSYSRSKLTALQIPAPATPNKRERKQPGPPKRRGHFCLQRIRKVCGEVVPRMATQAGFAKALGVSTSYVVRLENGQLAMTKVMAKRIARSVGVDRQCLKDPAGLPTLPPLVGFAHSFVPNDTEGATAIKVEPSAPPGWIVVGTPPEKAPRTVTPEFTVDAFRRWYDGGGKDKKPDPEYASIMQSAIDLDTQEISQDLSALLKAAAERSRLNAVWHDISEFLSETALAYGISETYARYQVEVRSAEKNLEVHAAADQKVKK